MTNLSFSSLSGVNLDDCILRDANFFSCALDSVNLKGADLHGAQFGSTLFANVNIPMARHLDTVQFLAPCSVDNRTLALSSGLIPDSFLQACGFARWEILTSKLYDPTLTQAEITELLYEIAGARSGAPICLGGIFISYSHEDSRFVAALYDELWRQGLPVWLDCHAAVSGPLAKQIFKAITETGLDFFVSRYFSSSQGRFTSADSIMGKRNNPQTLNRYTYVINNPLRFIDPFGYQSQDPEPPKGVPLDVEVIKINDAEQQERERRKKAMDKALGPIAASPNPFDWAAQPRRMCTAGVCGGDQTIGERLMQGAMAGDNLINDFRHRVKQAIPDGVQLNVTALFVISVDVTVTPDFDVFGGIDIPILSGWTDALKGGLKGRQLNLKSGLGGSLTGIYIIDPAVRDLSADGEARLGQSGAQDARRSFFNGTSYTVSGCYYLCGGGQYSSGRYAAVVGGGTPGVFVGASQSQFLFHFPVEMLPNPFKYLPK